MLELVEDNFKPTLPSMRMQTALMSDEHTVVTIKQVAAFHLALGGLLQNVVLIMTL